ncbi:MAG: right-handed parallel beta-helix repeat-containing protein [Planctomycetota bacterium]
MKTIALFALALLVIPATVAAGPVRVKDDAGLRRALAAAKPGSVILIAPGTYSGGVSAKGLTGKKNRPIVIAGADPKKPPVFSGGNVGIHLSAAAWVELRDLVVEKAKHNGLNLDDGGTADDPAHHVTLRRITVRDVGPRGNRDGIKLSGLDDFLVADCVLERWGSGGSGVDMVGCHDGEIVGCTFRNAGGPSGNGVQAKGGSRDVKVRHCRFERAGGRAVNIGGGTGLPYFRPRKPGYEAKDITVEDCVFVGSMAPVAFVGVDGGIVRHNVIYRPEKWVARILQETTGEDFIACRNGRFERNIVVFRSDEVRTAVNVGPGTKPKTFTFAENLWFCVDRPGASRMSLPVPEKRGVYGKDPRFLAPEKGDFRLEAKSPAKGYGPRPR